MGWVGGERSSTHLVGESTLFRNFRRGYKPSKEIPAYRGGGFSGHPTGFSDLNIEALRQSR